MRKPFTNLCRTFGRPENVASLQIYGCRRTFAGGRQQAFPIQVAENCFTRQAHELTCTPGSEGSAPPAKKRKETGQLELCFLPQTKCGRPKFKNSKFCPYHKRCYDGMQYQASKAGELETLAAALKTPESALTLFTKWEAKNPDDAKYKRKSAIDWAEFKIIEGQRQGETSRDVSQPMEEREFLIWATSKKGWLQAQFVTGGIRRLE